MKKDIVKKSICVVVAANKFSLINAAIIIKDLNLIKDSNFDINNIIAVNSNLLNELNLEHFSQIYVIGLNNQNMGKEILRNFLTKNYKKISFWFNENNINFTLKQMINSSVSQANCGESIEKYLYTKHHKIDGKYIDLLNTITCMKKRSRYKTELTNKFEHAIYAAQIYDRLFSDKNEDKPITRRIMQKLVKVSLNIKSNSVERMLSAYGNIKKNMAEAEKLKITHKLLGNMQVIKPKDDLVDRKIFFNELGCLSAIAVTALDKDIEGKIFEVCLSSQMATTINWETIPYIKRINGCRFLCEKSFLIQN